MLRHASLIARVLLLPLVGMANAAAAVEIDGIIDADEWRDARHVTDFRKVQPLNGDPASQPTEAWILSTPEGLAVAFRNTQPASVPRTNQRVQRDFESQVDRVNLMVDFDGDGRTGYDFTVSSTGGIYDAVISNETDFGKDWDGNWRHAVANDADGWTVEMLIPWYIAPMRDGDGVDRTIKVYLDRVIGSTGERVAWPQASFQRPRFLSDFTAIEVARHSQALLAVTPYVSGVRDIVLGHTAFDAGADILWKPNGRFQLTATINPDFGQVESDDLVVNFSATENYVSDKRPFFTENQGIFEFSTPSDYSQLLYTRRVGAPADDGNGAGDITAAIKLNGSLGAANYGIFLADESGIAGRSFGALRLVRDFATQNVGIMATRVDRPFLDRTATVVGVDHNWRPTPNWSVQTRLLGSEIDQAGTATRGVGATVFATWEMQDGWRQQWLGMHFGDNLQINDFGYLSRNDLDYLHWQVSRRQTDLPATSPFASLDWRGRISSQFDTGGLNLSNQLRGQVVASLRDGSNGVAQVNLNSAGYDDLITRGNGALRLPAHTTVYLDYARPRKGDWGHALEAAAVTGGLAGNDKLGYNIQYTPTYFASDALSLYFGVYAESTPDWLVWQYDNLVGSFRERALQLDIGMDWNIGSRQELRIKLQALALDAQSLGGFRVGAGGRPIASDDGVDDFNVQSLGFQIRYRYELAPLSYLYVVYARGGNRQDPFGEDPGALLGDAFGLRDAEQLLIKLSYRFER